MSDAIAQVQDTTYGQFGIGITNGTFESISIRTCIRGNPRGGGNDDDDNQGDEEGEEQYPLLLFSPGVEESRLVYANFLSSVASQGFVVVAVDHPYDVNAVEFPDGEVIQGINMTKDESTTLLDLRTRVEDMSFVLSQISPSSQSPSPAAFPSPPSVAPPSPSKKRGNKPNPILPPAVQQKTKVSDPVIFGHSFGGATAAQALYVDPRFVGGVNLDGILFGSVVGSGFGKPFLEMKSQTSSSVRDSTWKKFFGKLTGWKLQVQVQGAQHESFSDLGEIVNAIGAKGKNVDEIVGTISGERMIEIMTAYVSATARQAVLGTKEKLLDGPSKEYPEVKFLD
ncbi:PAF acetylhydrolase family protein [Aspergillus sclerotialis]|uniref:1-alkyl-2-acetylglycerophosphocholine esterase n=1 Tax=Aspergillus sclerotialis TaxID=2070753 RepID=A0A3A2ZRD8_9EURO|nr:PAF acetylhydrolase family protein [Aspergillus sclerotialis]